MQWGESFILIDVIIIVSERAAALDKRSVNRKKEGKRYGRERKSKMDWGVRPGSP